MAPRGCRSFARVASIERGAYTIAQVCERISMPRRTFFDLRARGELPFLDEVKPRLGRIVRYRADLVDQWVANQFQRESA